ncbi:YhgE/Pip family protein [Dellaglioa sp. BT-FLS60]
MSNNKKVIAYIAIACLIPSLIAYGMYKLVSNKQQMDTGNLKVAIINNDKEASFNGEEINVGKEVTKILKTNKQANWKFVSAKTAKKHLDSGDYTMSVTLPSNFSKNATTALDKTPKVSLLKTKQSDTNNYVSQLITKQVAEQLKSQVLTNIQKAYDSALLSSVKQLGSGVKEASTGVKTLNKGTIKLKNGSKEVTRNLDTLATSMVTFDKGNQTLKTGLNTYTNGVDTLASGVKTYTNGVGTLASGVKTYTNGVGTLASGVNTYTNGVGTLASGVNTYTSGVKTYTNGVNTLVDGDKQLSTGINTLVASAPTLANGVTQYVAGNKALDAGLSTLQSGGSTLAGGVGKLATGANTLNSNSADLNAGVQTLAAGMSGSQSLPMAVAGLTAYSTGIKTGVTQIQTKLKSRSDIIEHIPEIIKQIKETKNGSQELKNELAEIQESVTTLQALPALVTQLLAAGDKLTTVQAQMDKINASTTGKMGAMLIYNSMSAGSNKKVQTLITNSKTMSQEEKDIVLKQVTTTDTDIAKVGTNANGIKDNLLTTKAMLEETMGDMNSLMTQFKSTMGDVDLAAMLKKFDTITTQANALLSGTDALTGDSMIGLLSDTKDLSDQIDTLVTASNSNEQVAKKLNASVNGSSVDVTNEKTISDTINQSTMTNSVGKLSAGILSYTAGTSQVTDGINQLNSNVPTLTTGVSDLKAGSQKLVTAGGQLESGTQTLVAGGTQLKAGSDKLVSGGSQLTAASPQLATGGAQLVAGGSQLTAASPQLVAGGSQLTAASPQLVAGGSKLTAASPQLVAGGSQLTAASSQLTDGETQLASASPQLADGSRQLADGSKQVTTGLGTANDGVTLLNTKLADGASQVGDINSSPKNVAQFVEPVKTESESNNLAKTLKNTLAPLVIVLSLFVGAIVTQLILFRYRKKNELSQNWLQNLFLMLFISAIQTAGVLLLTVFFNVTIEHSISFVIFTFLSGVIFTLLCVVIDELLGTMGILLSLALLLVQLVITGQVIPNTMLSNTYQVFAAFLPVTHVLNGFTYAINSQGSGMIGPVLALLATVAVLGAIWAFLNRKQLTLQSENTAD